ncbi:MAG: hypothetical protein ACNI3C_07010 [Candidatus Marinarcus sp.]|uniref:hypothetical protein n=1 Tax=Candidatus Marinarcus sp. TaxID=3100987 RepID=UPI003B00284F
MNFIDLDEQTQQQLHKDILEKANTLGGKNFFLQMIEEIKKEKPNPILNKSAACHFSKGKLSWEKSIFKETYNTLFSAMQKEERDGDMLNGLKPKEYQATLNMMKTLKPVIITVKPKNEEAKGFSFPILDTSVEKNTKVSMLFKIIFFYHIDFAKDILSYTHKEQ